MTGNRSGRRFAVPALLVLAIGALAAGGSWYLHEGAIIPGDASDLDQVAFGSRVYGRICANCHGAELDGQLGWEEPLRDGTRLAPAHSTDGETWRMADETLFDVVKLGGQTLKPDGGVSRMPGFAEKLTDDEIWAVIAFMKSTWPADVQDAQQNAAMDEAEAR
ncbi:MAG: c-type cytochrome [Alphaproteobacteria bacterium]|nr:c-type cytochrome [Alphaproteobacteria bacterium]